MKILFLGTGAGEFYPAMLCTCEMCSKYRNDGKILGFSSILIDNRFLIDAPPGTNLNFAEFKIEPEFPFHIFITHSHQDHFDPMEIISPRESKNNSVYIHINKTIADLLEHYKKFNRFFDLTHPAHENMFLKKLAAFKKVVINRNDYFIPVLANHDKTYNEESFNYIIKIKDKKLLYASDTGFYDNEKTWYHIFQHQYNMLIMEFSFTPTNGTHLDYRDFMSFIERLKKHECINEKTQIIATHLHLHRIDSGQIELLEKAGIKIAYRGMKCEC